MAAPSPVFADEPALVEVADYWTGRRRGRLIPDRDGIDPLDLSPAIWPNLLLSEPVAGSTAWRYRLVGSAHVERYGFDFTGKTTAEIMQGSYLDYMNSIYATACGRALPVYSESVFRWDAQGFAMTRRLMLPLSRGIPDQPAVVLSVQVWPTAMPVSPHPIGELSRSGGFRDGMFQALDRDSFQPLPHDS
jgi:hypothetical protein